jgi:hypothetical protein
MSRKKNRAERLKLAKEFRIGADQDRKVRLIPRDLKLIHVPESEREAIRSFLTPLLRKVIIKAQDCWNVGQQLTKAASSTRVAYVEGVYQNKEDFDCECGCCHAPKPHGWNTVDGHIVDLGTLAGLKESLAFAINNSDVIVGASEASSVSGTRRATVWNLGRIMDLNDLIPPNSGWVLTDGGAINDRGQIAGAGVQALARDRVEDA